MILRTAPESSTAFFLPRGNQNLPHGKKEEEYCLWKNKVPWQNQENLSINKIACNLFISEQFSVEKQSCPCRENKKSKRCPWKRFLPVNKQHTKKHPKKHHEKTPFSKVQEKNFKIKITNFWNSSKKQQ